MRKIALLLLLTSTIAHAQISMDLSGQWLFSSSPDMTAAVQVALPGTTDTNGIGEAPEGIETTQLTRKHRYCGSAYYEREIEIPEQWKDYDITLFLERSRPTSVWVDGKEAGSCRYLSVPHLYDLTDFLCPGKHQLRVLVNNCDSIPLQIRENSHSCCESTQTNWNGIIGRMELVAAPATHITKFRVNPQPKDGEIQMQITVTNPQDGMVLEIELASEKKLLPLAANQVEYSISLPLGSIQLWSERNPHLYEAKAKLSNGNERICQVGFRDFRAKDRHFAVNDTVTFLRGKHDGCVFPLTGYPPMDVEGWREYFATIKDYGLNHVRFHSWCPPEACFAAADIEGIYLQPELTIWGGFYENQPELMEFLMNDGRQIIEQYSHHPSFVLFSLGNELWGDVAVMRRFVDEFRDISSSQLYAMGTNSFLGFQGSPEGQDFFATCRVGGGDGYSTHCRASFSFADADDGGYLNHCYPNTNSNFESAVLLSPVPVIGHETGQFQTYPQYSEIDKYTGVLSPDNFREFQRRLEAARLGNQAEDFFKASGQWSARLYLADMEMNFRTPSMAGFQLLDLQDYPGQGTALVGLLDAFMQPKGLIEPEKWRQSCSEIVALGLMPKRCWSSKEAFSVEVAVANYSGNSLRGQLDWTLKIGTNTIKAGSLDIAEGDGLLKIGSLNIELPEMEQAQKGALELFLPEHGVRNEYELWFYPQQELLFPKNLIVAHVLDDAVMNALNEGKNVLLAPVKSDVDSVVVGGLFQTDYWNYRMFRTISQNNGKEVSPGTMGLLIDAEHPSLKGFPTEFHTNWQWFQIVKNSYPIIMDVLNPIEYKPIVQAIDNIERNHRLGLLSEFAVGDGKLLMLMADMNAISQRPEGIQFLNSIMEYAAGQDFAPSVRLSPADLKEMFSTSTDAENIQELNNISY